MAESRGTESYGRRYLVLAAVMSGSILGPIDGSIVNVILPTITESFGASFSTAQWVPMIYLLTISSLLLTYGRLGDILGYKKVFAAGLVCFVASSALCALSPTIHLLILFRAVQGFAAAMMMAMPFALITVAFPARERGKALGIYAISISVGLAVGPSLGGFMAAWLGWRSAFLINVPIGLFAFAWSWKVLPDVEGRPGKMDLRGSALGFVALFSALLFVNRLQSEGATRLVAAMFAAAVLAGTLFVLEERRTRLPMLDFRIFRSRTFSFACLASLLNFIAQFVVVFLVPFYLQRVLHEGPSEVGVVMTAFPLAVLCVAPFSGAISDRVGTSLPAFVGASISALALFMMAALPASAQPWHVGWRLALFGVGAGIFQSPNNSAVMGNAPVEHLGIASSLVATVRNVGMVLGIALGGAVLYAVTPRAVLQMDRLAGADARAFLEGLRASFSAGAGAAVLAALASLVRTGRLAGGRAAGR